MIEKCLPIQELEITAFGQAVHVYLFEQTECKRNEKKQKQQQQCCSTIKL